MEHDATPNPRNSTKAKTYHTRRSCSHICPLVLNTCWLQNTTTIKLNNQIDYLKNVSPEKPKTEQNPTSEGHHHTTASGEAQ